MARGGAEKSEQVKFVSSLQVAGEEVIKEDKPFVFTNNKKANIASLKQKFQEYCETRRKKKSSLYQANSSNNEVH